MSRTYTNKIHDKIAEGIYTHESILNEMLCFFSEDEIEDFYKNSFGNEGL